MPPIIKTQKVPDHAVYGVFRLLPGRSGVRGRDGAWGWQGVGGQGVIPQFSVPTVELETSHCLFI